MATNRGLFSKLLFMLLFRGVGALIRSYWNATCPDASTRQMRLDMDPKYYDDNCYDSGCYESSEKGLDLSFPDMLQKFFGFQPISSAANNTNFSNCFKVCGKYSNPLSRLFFPHNELNMCFPQHGNDTCVDKIMSEVVNKVDTYDACAAYLNPTVQSPILWSLLIYVVATMLYCMLMQSCCCGLTARHAIKTRCDNENDPGWVEPYVNIAILSGFGCILPFFIAIVIAIVGCVLGVGVLALPIIGAIITGVGGSFVKSYVGVKTRNRSERRRLLKMPEQVEGPYQLVQDKESSAVVDTMLVRSGEESPQEVVIDLGGEQSPGGPGLYI